MAPAASEPAVELERVAPAKKCPVLKEDHLVQVEALQVKELKAFQVYPVPRDRFLAFVETLKAAQALQVDQQEFPLARTASEAPVPLVLVFLVQLQVPVHLEAAVAAMDPAVLLEVVPWVLLAHRQSEPTSAAEVPPLAVCENQESA